MGNIKKLIRSDLYRYGNISLFKAIRIPGFKYSFVLRRASSGSSKNPLTIFFKILHRYYSTKYSFQIPIKTQIGKGFYIGHFGTIVINSGASIGDNCNIAHSVTIGQANRGSKKGVPNIGNKVWIGTGSVIVGGVHIGDNVLIAPNSYVNFDVPSNSVVMGNPGKIIEKIDATVGYIENISDD